MSGIDRRRAVLALAAAPFTGRTAAYVGTTPTRRSATASVLSVGPARPYRTLAAAVSAARAGDTIEVDAADYRGDVAILDKDFLRIVGPGGRARLTAAGADVEGKGILVVRAHGVEIENIELIGARVADHYGSAIRLEKGSLMVKNCRFSDNELGVMTANDPSIALEILGCEFSGLVDGRGRGAALSHCLYAGAIGSLRVEGSYFHDGSKGHLIKSRARSSVIRYNRLTDQNGVSSYELEFPDGGLAEVVGNVIQKGRRSENIRIVSFGAEGLRWKDNRLDVLFNTLVNEAPTGGYFVSVLRPGISTIVRYNVLFGSGAFRLGSEADARSNVRAKRSDFASPADLDFRPRVGTTWAGAAAGVERDLPQRLVPTAEYKHPASTKELPHSKLGALNPGAFQTLVR